MHLTALVDSAEHVCCRYRLAAYRPFLERAGHTLEFEPWPESGWSSLITARRLRRADAVIVQRRLLPAWRLFLLRRWARLLIYDFDDAVFLRDSYAAKGLECGRRLRRFSALMRSADAIVAGNPFLAGQAVRQGANPQAVAVVPTCVDPSRYLPAKHVSASDVVRLVWIGSSSTLQGLERLRPVFEELGQRMPKLRLQLVCDRFLELKHLAVERCPWVEAREASDLAAADIGISWLPDDDWSRGKCGLKVLQYMAAGLPVVANPVGVQADLVRHGETGFHARTREDWVDAVARLAGDVALRRRQGRAGRERLEAEFSVTEGAARWVILLNKLGRKLAAA